MGEKEKTWMKKRKNVGEKRKMWVKKRKKHG